MQRGKEAEELGENKNLSEKGINFAWSEYRANRESIYSDFLLLLSKVEKSVATVFHAAGQSA